MNVFQGYLAASQAHIGGSISHDDVVLIFILLLHLKPPITEYVPQYIGDGLRSMASWKVFACQDMIAPLPISINPMGGDGDV